MGLWSVALAGCAEDPSGEAPCRGFNVILISIDTTRADHLGCYGHPQVKTPNIDRLAAEGVLFEQCVAAVPVTLPSHASLLTGAYPFVHRVRDNGTFQLHADNVTLAEALADAGYATAAQVGAFVMNHEFGLDQGFAVYRDVQFDQAGGPNRRLGHEFTAEQVTDGAIELLRQVADRRFFLFVHYFDPHQPYEPPPRFARQYIQPYQGEIAYTDEQIGRLLRGVEEASVGGQTLIVLTSDHGESLGQHQEATHAYFLYDSTLVVPLIVWCPPKVPSGRRIATQVRLIDVAPTVLGLLGVPRLPHAQGADLSPLILGHAMDLRLEAYAETFYNRYNLGFAQLRAWRSDGWKYIHAAPPELYDLATDPRELRNLAPSQPERVAEMRARLRELLTDVPRVVSAPQARRSASPQDLRRLESLGYVAGGAAAAEDVETDELLLFEPVGPNPMEHAREIRLTTRAVGLVRTGQHAKIEKAIRELLAEFGERSRRFVWAHAHLAGALAAQGKLEEALTHFDIAIEGRPEDGQMHTMKGLVLRALGRNEQAIAAFQQAAALEPVFAVTYLNLGEALTAADRTDEALEQYRLAVKTDPRMLRAHVNLAELLAASDRIAEALATVGRALEIARSNGDTETVGQLETLRRRYSRHQQEAAETP
jgi:arylsulfatase A-like enzyme/Tfp pilus assembly protein PilF